MSEDPEFEFLRYNTHPREQALRLHLCPLFQFCCELSMCCNERHLLCASQLMNSIRLADPYRIERTSLFRINVLCTWAQLEQTKLQWTYWMRHLQLIPVKVEKARKLCRLSYACAYITQNRLTTQWKHHTSSVHYTKSQYTKLDIWRTYSMTPLHKWCHSK